MPRLAPALALLAALLLVACAAPPAATPAQPGTPSLPATAVPAVATASGGTLRVGRTAAPDSLNPGASYIVESGDIIDMVYDTLIRIDLKNQPYPGLARTWRASDDGRSWTFTLAENARWHDGQPVTAADVVFTFDMIRGFDSFGLIKEATSQIASVAAPDPRTVVVSFEGPVANTDERFATVPILPKHIWEQFATEQAATEFENREMIGSGPFRMAEYRPGEFTRLTAVKDHYATPPKVDELIYRVFGAGDAMVQALRAGELDMIAVPTNTVVRSLQATANISVAIGSDRSLVDIIFNVVAPENCPPEVGRCTGHPALQDVRVRQALAHATDKQALIDGVLLGLGQPGIALVTPAHGEAFAADAQDYAHDPARANQILEAAGYRDSNGDGIREMPNDPARPLSLRYSYPSDQYAADGPRTFELLRDQWRQAGVELTVTPLENTALTAACCPAFDFDVIQWGWSAGVDPASLLYIATTEQIPTGISETGYANPEYDRLFVEQGATLDRARRIELLKQMQAILLRDVPYIIPWYPQAVQAYRTDTFTGWAVEPDGRLQLYDRLSLVNVSPVP